MLMSILLMKPPCWCAACVGHYWMTHHLWRCCIVFHGEPDLCFFTIWWSLLSSCLSQAAASLSFCCCVQRFVPSSDGRNLIRLSLLVLLAPHHIQLIFSCPCSFTRRPGFITGTHFSSSLHAPLLSVNSWKDGFTKCVSRHRSEVRSRRSSNKQSKVALTRFLRVLVEPREEVKTSSIPANWRTKWTVT